MTDDLGPWEPYDVATVRRLLAPTAVTWWLSGGVALDVFLGYESRPHDDIDVSVRRAHWPVLERHLVGALDVFAAKDGRLTRRAAGPLAVDVDNLWARERGGRAWRLQVNLEAGDQSRWAYRRDPRVTRDWREVIAYHGALPYVNPAVQLLWKAKHVVAKDQIDFDNVVPRLERDDRHWLAWAVGLAHPTSPWVVLLEPRPTGYL